MSVPLRTGDSTFDQRSRISMTPHRHLPSVRMQTPLRQAVMDRVGIGHALVDNCSFKGVCDAIVSHAKAGGKPAYVTTANAQHIVLLDEDRRLEENI